jgi:hypothetical protein
MRFERRARFGVALFDTVRNFRIDAAAPIGNTR